jgi:penicillin-binding protein 2
MYDKRVKIFVIVIGLLLLVCVLRLVQMQLLADSSLQDAIAELQQGKAHQLKTVRGTILDRKGKVLAVDEPRFQLCIEYKLSRFLDQRVARARLLRAAKQNNAEAALPKVQKELQAGLENLQQVIEKCTRFGHERAEIEQKIKNINDRMWNLRTFVAWVRNGPDPNIVDKYGQEINSVPLSEAIADFARKFPDEDERLLLVGKVADVAEMGTTQPLLELETDDDIFAAQVEFLDFDAVEILPGARRFYPFGSLSAQTIGWVGPATGSYRNLFENDRLASYLEDEVCGKRPGVEYVCEAILRGKRGELVYDIDRQLISRTETQFGKDVTLTLDIQLQQRIENYLASYPHDPNCGPGTAAVVIDAGTGDILALVSMPVFDLNRARFDYDSLVKDSNEPLINRAICEQYPPGSVIKPVILIAALESGKISPDEIIPCPAQKAPVGWPSCWIYNRNHIGHDYNWSNNARNAVKGSCNIYFSQLADRIEPSILQQWLYKFGYGRTVPTLQIHNSQSEIRGLRQAAGQISSLVPRPSSLAARGQGHEPLDLPPLAETERRLFGIGQGNLRVTPLQVANAMAAIARGGVFKQPRLFREMSDLECPAANLEPEPLGISPQTLEVVRDGMYAVVNESGGTAYKEFAHSGLPEQGVQTYGKTGSTEAPEVAWFAGFAKDNKDRSIAIAVVVEGGQHGSSDAAPLARDIIQFCIDAGYIGNPQR